MIEKEIVTLTAVAQEMQECPGNERKNLPRALDGADKIPFFLVERQKYVEALMKIARRINDVEDKASSCIKEARLQLKKVSTLS